MLKKRNLTEAQVHKICELLTDPTYSQADIAIDLNVPPYTVSNIKNGRSYREISSQYSFPPTYKFHPYRIGNDVVHEICRLFQDTDKPFAEIARITNTSESWVRLIYNRLERTDISSKYTFRERVNGRKRGSTVISDEVISEICEFLMDPTITYQEISEVIGVKVWVVVKVYRHEIVSDIIDKYEFPPRIRGRRSVTTFSKKITVEETRVEETDFSDELDRFQEENEQLRKELQARSAYDIDEELEGRYKKANAEINEIQLLTKLIEECGELIGEASGIVCEYTGFDIRSWKGKNKTHRQELLHEWMDVYRMMQLWIEKFATEEELEKMSKMSVHKIKKIVERHESKR